MGSITTSSWKVGWKDIGWKTLAGVGWGPYTIVAVECLKLTLALSSPRGTIEWVGGNSIVPAGPSSRALLLYGPTIRPYNALFHPGFVSLLSHQHFKKLQIQLIGFIWWKHHPWQKRPGQRVSKQGATPVFRGPL